MNWQNRKALVTDLESQLCAIKVQIAPADQTEGLALVWRFMQFATPLFERCWARSRWPPGRSQGRWQMRRLRLCATTATASMTA